MSTKTACSCLMRSTHLGARPSQCSAHSFGIDAELCAETRQRPSILVERRSFDDLRGGDASLTQLLVGADQDRGDGRAVHLIPCGQPVDRGSSFVRPDELSLLYVRETAGDGSALGPHGSRGSAEIRRMIRFILRTLMNQPRTR
jgi:hypothetical protein